MGDGMSRRQTKNAKKMTDNTAGAVHEGRMNSGAVEASDAWNFG